MRDCSLVGGGKGHRMGTDIMKFIPLTPMVTTYLLIFRGRRIGLGG